MARCPLSQDHTTVCALFLRGVIWHRGLGHVTNLQPLIGPFSSELYGQEQQGCSSQGFFSISIEEKSLLSVISRGPKTTATELGPEKEHNAKEAQPIAYRSPSRDPIKCCALEHFYVERGLHRASRCKTF